jgi:hypothetical protein
MIKVKILKEVYSKKQRKFFCASDDPELKKMCDDPMKNEEQLDEVGLGAPGSIHTASGGGKRDDDEKVLDEMSAMGSGGTQGTSSPLGKRDEIKKFNKNEEKKSHLKEDDTIEEMYSTSGHFSHGNSPNDVDEFAGFAERSAMQGLKNVPKPKKKIKVSIKRKKKLNLNENSSAESLLSFATKERNQKHLKIIINKIFESYKFEQLWRAVITDNTAKDRIEFISSNIPDVSPNLYKEILKGNEQAIRDYYSFIAVEYLYWTLTNPRAHPSRKGVGIFEMTSEIRNYVMAHIDRYAHSKYGKSSKHNPKSLSQSTIGPNSPSQKDYGEEGDLDPLLFKLPE